MQKRPKKNSNPEVMELFLKDLKARYEEGVRRYGVPLQPFNERDADWDASTGYHLPQDEYVAGKAMYILKLEERKNEAIKNRSNAYSS